MVGTSSAIANTKKAPSGIRRIGSRVSKGSQLSEDERVYCVETFQYEVLLGKLKLTKVHEYNCVHLVVLSPTDTRDS